MLFTISFREKGKLVGQSYDYFYDITPMLLQAWPGVVGGITMFNLLPCERAAPLIASAIIYLLDLDNLEKLTRLEPTNGRGSRKTLIYLLKCVHSNCKQHPKSIMEIRS